MQRRLLTLDDLYEYHLKKGQSFRFSAKEEKSLIIVQVPETITFSDEYDPQAGLLKTHLKSCHLFENRNKTFISEESMKEAIPSFFNRPILGYIYKTDDGSYDFAGHEIGIDENGELEYYEIPVGVIPESANPQLIYDKDADKTYLEIDGLIYEDYSRAASILREKKEAKVSVELAIEEMSYSATDKVLNLDKFYFTGVTILGKDVETGKQIKEGMAGSNITLANFSAEENSHLTNKVMEMLEEINLKIEAISKFSIDTNQKKGGTSVTKFEELLNKYSVTAEQIDFEYENLSDEELEAKFAEKFESETEEDPSTDPISAPDGDESDLGEEQEDDNDDDHEDNDNENGGNDDSDGEPEPEVEPVKYSMFTITMSDGTAKTFDVSYDEIQNALHVLVNTAYGDDNTWYSCRVYESYLLMIDYWNNKSYKQAYSKDDEGNVALVGDREEVFCHYLTKAEEDALAEMRSNYSTIKSQLESYQAKETTAAKKELIVSKDYAAIAEKADFAELASSVMSETDNLSFEDLKAKCDELLLTYAKSGSLTFSAAEVEEKPIKTVKLPVKTTGKKNSRYGSLKFN